MNVKNITLNSPQTLDVVMWFYKLNFSNLFLVNQSLNTRIQSLSTRIQSLNTRIQPLSTRIQTLNTRIYLLIFIFFI